MFCLFSLLLLPFLIEIWESKSILFVRMHCLTSMSNTPCSHCRVQRSQFISSMFAVATASSPAVFTDGREEPAQCHVQSSFFAFHGVVFALVTLFIP